MRHLNSSENEFYRRNILIPEVGERGQEKLLNSRVMVVGAGGLGSPALFYLAVAGIGKIDIIDSDRVELSNLQRQILHGYDNIGDEKVRSAEETLLRVRPDLKLNLYNFRLDEKNAQDILSSSDFVIEATDNFESKFLISDACVSLGKPFSTAGILGMFGQTMTVIPGKSPCFRCVFQDVPEPGSVSTTAEVGVLGSIPGVLGPIQATEAIKYLIGTGRLLSGRLLTYDALEMTFREVPLPESHRCSLCLEL